MRSSIGIENLPSHFHFRHFQHVILTFARDSRSVQLPRHGLYDLEDARQNLRHRFFVAVVGASALHKALQESLGPRILHDVYIFTISDPSGLLGQAESCVIAPEFIDKTEVFRILSRPNSAFRDL